MKDGVVVLANGVKLKDGTLVEVEPLRPSRRGPVGQRLKRFSGTARALPSDMVENHDHYLHASAITPAGDEVMSL